MVYTKVLMSRSNTGPGPGPRFAGPGPEVRVRGLQKGAGPWTVYQLQVFRHPDRLSAQLERTSSASHRKRNQMATPISKTHQNIYRCQAQINETTLSRGCAPQNHLRYRCLVHPSNQTGRFHQKYGFGCCSQEPPKGPTYSNFSNYRHTQNISKQLRRHPL